MPSASQAKAIGTDAWRSQLRTIRSLDKIVSDILLDASNEAFRAVAALDGLDSTSAQVRRAQYKQALGSLARIQGEAWSSISPELAAHATAAAAQGIDGVAALDALLADEIADATLRASLVASIDRADDLIKARLANNIKLAPSVYNTQALAQGWVEREVNRGVALGRSAREIAASVRGMINPNVKGGVSYAAMRLGRTELNNAFHTATILRASDDPWTKGFKWYKSDSHPRPDPCDALAEDDHDGLGPGVFLPKNVPGKPHPQCLCYVVVVQIEEDEFIDKLIAGDYDEHIAERSGVAIEAGPKVVTLSKEQMKDRFSDMIDDGRLTRAQEEKYYNDRTAYGRSLNGPQFQAWKTYTGSGYAPMNDQLRHGKPAPGRFGTDLQHLLSPSMPREKTPYAKLYRGIPDARDADGVPNLTFKPGDRFMDKGFVSTSPSPYEASEFSGRLGTGGRQHRTFFIIDTTKMKGRAVGMPGNGDEVEWILPPNSTFEVGTIEEYTTADGGVHRIVNLLWDGIDE